MRAKIKNDVLAKKRKRVTEGGASSKADLVGCQFKHGSFLPKKAP